MQTLPWDETATRGFEKAAQSLRLYRRADLHDPDNNTPLIDALYVDPLPDDYILRKIVQPHTTFVVGRKGTGKSTIFQRLQSELRKTKHQTSAYVDIKTVYESSQADPSLVAKAQAFAGALPPDSLERLLMYREFLRAVVNEIKRELRKRVEASLFERIKHTFTGGLDQLFQGLDALLKDASDDRFISALGAYAATVGVKSSSTESDGADGSLKVSVGKDAQVTGSAAGVSKRSLTSDHESKYADVLVRTFSIKEFVERLKSLLETLGVRHLFVLIDDFSELPEPAMRVVVDVLLAPLNNWSDEFIKFKVAAYPGRIYFGAIDKTKVDDIFLDLYSLYGAGDVAKMEDSAIAFTRRLVERRIEHYCPGRRIQDKFAADEREIWRTLFFASMANPRILGYILAYIYEARLLEGRGISVAAVQDAARRFYEDKVESYFVTGKFLHETFSERASIFSLKELLEAVVVRARALRSHDSEVFKKIKGRPHTSHFHVPVPYEGLFSSLELNFFLTKYFEMSDRDGRKVSIFALNLGMCERYDIRFGRPLGEREFRTYFIERVFDYTAIVRAYVERNQEIVCQACGQRYAYEHLEALRFYGMMCKECKVGTVVVANLSRKYEAQLKQVDKELLLPATDLGILQALHVDGEPLRAGEIAEELDCSYQLVGKRAKVLADRGLVKRYKEDKVRFFLLEDLAERAYFSKQPTDSLQLEPEKQVEK